MVAEQARARQLLDSLTKTQRRFVKAIYKEIVPKLMAMGFRRVVSKELPPPFKTALMGGRGIFVISIPEQDDDSGEVFGVCGLSTSYDWANDQFERMRREVTSELEVNRVYNSKIMRVGQDVLAAIRVHFANALGLARAVKSVANAVNGTAYPLLRTLTDSITAETGSPPERMLPMRAYQTIQEHFPSETRHDSLMGLLR